MPANQNFRSALNGFNRSDVVNYIEEVSILHEKELRVLRDENDKLRTNMESLQNEMQSLHADLDALTAPAAPAEPVEEPPIEEAPVISPAPAAPALNEQELAAYRRAELMERNAKRRAAALFAQVNEIVESTTTQFERSGSSLESLMSDLTICLRQMDDTLAELRLNFGETTDAFAAIAPLSAEEE